MTIRILTEFAAGAITYLIVSRISGADGVELRSQPERLATTLSVALPLLVVVGAVVLGNLSSLQWPGAGPNEPPKLHLVLVPLLVAWIGALAVSRRGLVPFLATQRLVLGGYISYSLYMTHTVWYGLWRAGAKAVGVEGGPVYAVGVVACSRSRSPSPGSCGDGWRSPPGNGWRRRIGARPKPVEDIALAEPLTCGSPPSICCTASKWSARGPPPPPADRWPPVLRTAAASHRVPRR